MAPLTPARNERNITFCTTIHQEAKMTVPYVKYVGMKDLQIKLGGRSRSSIYRDIENGRLPAPRGRGKRLFWIEEEVDACLEKHRIEQS